MSSANVKYYLVGNAKQPHFTIFWHLHVLSEANIILQPNAESNPSLKTFHIIQHLAVEQRRQAGLTILKNFHNRKYHVCISYIICSTISKHLASESNKKTALPYLNADNTVYIASHCTK